MELSKSFTGGLTKANKSGKAWMGVAFAIFGCLLVMAFPVGGFAILETGIFDAIPEWAGPVGFFALFCGGFAVLVAGGAAVSALRTQMRRRKVEDATVRIEEPVRPGGSFDVRYEQRVNNAVDITSMSVKLVMREWVRWTSGTDTYTRTHDVVLDERVLPSRHYTSGSMIAETVRFQLPQSAMHTWANRHWVTEKLMDEDELAAARQEWEARIDKMPQWMQNITADYSMANNALATGIDDNTITWHVLFQVDIPRTPDYNQAWELPVVPKLPSEERSLF